MASSKRDLIAFAAFHGTSFWGYQSQGAARGRYVQDVLSAALARALALPSPVALLATSRTDSGVHARELLLRASVPCGAACDASAASAAEAWNAALPSDVRITRFRWARPSQISARAAVSGKQYSFYVRVGAFHDSLAASPFSMHVPDAGEPGAAARIAAAVSQFVGTHDFVRFSMLRSRRSNERERVRSEARGERGGAAKAAAEAGSGDGCVESAEAASSEKSPGLGDESLGRAAAHPVASRTVRTVVEADVHWLTLGDLQPALDAGAPPVSAGMLVSPTDARELPEGAAVCRGRVAWQQTEEPHSGAKRRLSADGAAGASGESSGAAEAAAGPPLLLRLRFVGNGFLRHQVRHMVGAAIAVGRGALPLNFVRDTLASSAAAPPAAGTRAPFSAAAPRGLWLERSLLDADFWVDDQWCNNSVWQYCVDKGIDASSWHPPVRRDAPRGAVTGDCLVDDNHDDDHSE